VSRSCPLLRLGLTLLCLAALAAGRVGDGLAAGPQDPATLVDRIVAVVGDTAITQSEMQEYIFRLQAQGVRPPQDRSQGVSFLEQVLDQKINEVLLVIYAEREGITAKESEINEVVEDRIAQIRRNFPSEIEFQQALAREGVSSAEFRMRVYEQARAEYMAQQFLQVKVGQMQPVPVSEDEIRERFEAQRATLGPRPATISLKQVVLTPQASEESQLLALEKIEQVLSRARSGEDFALLAREFSEDPVSAQNGGELGWVRQGDLVAEFENALFSMQVGEISDVVETLFGFHIIKLDRVRGAERSARHILVRPEMTAADTARAHELADEIAAALRAGADPDSLIRLHSDPDERSSLTQFPQDRLPAEYQQLITAAQSGDVIGPFRLELPGIEGGKWVVAEILELDPGGEWSIDDARESVRQSIQQERMLQKVVDGLRKKTYVVVQEDAIVTMVSMLYAAETPIR
jgi:peptidyl-prolyl cis-trans isomerase SurA